MFRRMIGENADLPLYCRQRKTRRQWMALMPQAPLTGCIVHSDLWSKSIKVLYCNKWYGYRTPNISVWGYIRTIKVKSWCLFAHSLSHCPITRSYTALLWIEKLRIPTTIVYDQNKPQFSLSAFWMKRERRLMKGIPDDVMIK